MKPFQTTLLLVCAGVAFGQPAQYGGPSVLSRGGPPSNAHSGGTTFRPYAGVEGIYDSGLVGVSADSNGRVIAEDDYGLQGTVGIYGQHAWRKTILSLDYRGSLRHYSRHSYFNGSDHFLTLGVGRQLSRRTLLTVNENAGTYTRNYGSFNSASAAGADTVGLPGIDLFDNRVYFANTAADVRYQKSLRLSFDGGASGFVVQRAAGALFGVVGATARGDVSYRYSRVGTVGVDYYFTHFDFKKAFGGSDIHSMGLNWALRLSRTWEFAMRIGASRIESKFLHRVTIDPAVQEITGQLFGIEVGHRVSLMPDLSGRLAKNFRHAMLQFNYQRRVNPGNGIFLTSMQEHAGFDYSYRGIRRWNFGLNASYNRMGALVQNTGQFTAYQAGLGIARQLSRDFHLVMRADMRKFNLGGGNYNRNAVRTTLGFTYSPGERPLALW